MKKQKLLGVLTIFLFYTNSLYSQQWRKYWNSAFDYESKQNFEEAVRFYHKAKHYLETDAYETKNYAFLCISLAGCYLSLGMYHEAESLLDDVKKIVESPDQRWEAYLHSAYDRQVGNLYFNLGQYKKAASFTNAAIEIMLNSKTGDLLDFVPMCTNLAVIYSITEDFAKAEQIYLLAKQACLPWLSDEKVADRYYDVCIGLANLYGRVGQIDKALPLSLEIKQQIEASRGRENFTYAEVCNNIGHFYTDKARFDSAENFGLEAKSIFEKIVGKQNQNYVNTCLMLGRIYRMQGKLDKANEYYSEAAQAEDEQIRKIFQFTSEEEKQSYLAQIKVFEDQVLTFYTLSSFNLSNGFAYNFYLSKSNLILSSLRQLKKAVFASNDQEIKKKYEAWISLRNEISVYYSKPINASRIDIKHLEEEANKLEKALAISSSAFGTRNITWQEIQENLRLNEAAIQFVDFQSSSKSRLYAALVLRKNKPGPEIVKLFFKEEIDSLLFKYSSDETENISALYTRKENDPGYSLSSLYDIIWRPLEGSLDGITRIYFSPSGILNKISFAALPIDKKQVLSDKYELVQLTSTASIMNQFPIFISHSDAIQLYGGIRYDADSTSLEQAAVPYSSITESSSSSALSNIAQRGSSIRYLPGTAAEVENIKKELGSSNENIKIFFGVNATEESFKALNGKVSPGVIHIATHGFFFPDPKSSPDDDLIAQFKGKAFKKSENPLFRCGLLFAGANYAWQGKPLKHLEDGILTAYEVSNMYLPNTKLAVLSACETALGDIQGNEGVYGLQRAFKIAGVQNLVMSLWKVPDIETSEFMQEFYKNMFDGKSISEAFYQAQTMMKNKYRGEPSKWAAWILVR